MTKAKIAIQRVNAIRFKRVTDILGFGGTPSLARVLARLGGGALTVLAAEEVPPNVHAGGRERSWVLRLSPTLNIILPFGSIDRLAWDIAIEIGSNNQPSGGTAVLRALLQKNADTLDPHEGLTAAEALVDSCDQTLFGKFFRVLR